MRMERFDIDGRSSRITNSEYSGEPYAAYLLSRLRLPGSPAPSHAVRALEQLGFTTVGTDEEAAGDGNWHLWAFDQPPTSDRKARIEQVKDVALETGCVFDGGYELVR